MSDRPSDRDVEARLATAFRAGGLPQAPGRLLDALERIPDGPVDDDADADARGERRGRRTALWLVGLAAVVALGGAAVLGSGAIDARPRPGPVELPSGPLGTVVTYEIQWTAGTPFDEATLALEVAAIQRRLDAIAGPGGTARAVDGDHVMVAIPGGVDPEPFRRFAGQAGRVTFVPLGLDGLEEGEPVDPGQHPALFGNEGISDAGIGIDQSGLRVVEFRLTPAASRSFADYTGSHVGEYFAIVLDGLVVSAPRIMSAIPGGEVQITKDGTEGGYPLAEAQQLVATMLGPLPAPIVELSHGPGAAPTASG